MRGAVERREGSCTCFRLFLRKQTCFLEQVEKEGLVMHQSTPIA